MKTTKTLIAISVALISTCTIAAEPYQKRVSYDDSFRDYGVITSINTQYDEVSRPTEVCKKEIVREKMPQQQAQSNEDSPAGVIIGGIAGGILGHQVGGGTGKDIATAAGAVTGAIVGNNLAKKNQIQADSTPRFIEKEAIVCHNENKVERIVSGYRVEYTYGGKTFQTVLREKPNGSKIQLNVTVSPLN